MNYILAVASSEGGRAFVCVYLLAFSTLSVLVALRHRFVALVRFEGVYLLREHRPIFFWIVTCILLLNSLYFGSGFLYNVLTGDSVLGVAAKIFDGSKLAALGGALALCAAVNSVGGILFLCPSKRREALVRDSLGEVGELCPSCHGFLQQGELLRLEQGEIHQCRLCRVGLRLRRASSRVVSAGVLMIAAAALVQLGVPWLSSRPNSLVTTSALLLLLVGFTFILSGRWRARVVLARP